MSNRIGYKRKTWLNFDLWYEVEKEKLERIAWNCHGFLGGYIPPFPADVIRIDLNKKLLEYHEKQICKLLRVPENLMGETK